MAGLLVSVRSAAEARAAWRAGAAVIDVKEPGRGPLGAADPEVWAAVRSALPPSVPVSIALGELEEFAARPRPLPPAECCAGINYCKVGLAGMGGQARAEWLDRWTELRQRWRGVPAWVAVAYADWELAHAPHPDDVLEAALGSDCVGILIDTWDKSRPSPIDLSWKRWVNHARSRGRFVAIAGGLDERSIPRLAALEPNLFAVRGAACRGGDRNGPIDPVRVACLASAARTDVRDLGIPSVAGPIPLTPAAVPRSGLGDSDRPRA